MHKRLNSRDVLKRAFDARSVHLYLDSIRVAFLIQAIVQPLSEISL